MSRRDFLKSVVGAPLAYAALPTAAESAPAAAVDIRPGDAQKWAGLSFWPRQKIAVSAEIERRAFEDIKRIALGVSLSTVDSPAYLAVVTVSREDCRWRVFLKTVEATQVVVTIDDIDAAAQTSAMIGVGPDTPPACLPGFEDRLRGISKHGLASTIMGTEYRLARGELWHSGQPELDAAINKMTHDVWKRAYTSGRLNLDRPAVALFRAIAIMEHHTPFQIHVDELKLIDARRYDLTEVFGIDGGGLDGKIAVVAVAGGAA